MKKLKGLLSLILAVQIIISLSFAVKAEETSNICGENLTWEITDGVLTISGTGEMYDWTNDSLPVWKGSSITSVVIEEGVTSIGDLAFCDLSKLTCVTISDTVLSIGETAFYNCQKLENITIPDSVITIKSSAFSRCKALTEINIPENLTVLEDYTFKNCESLKSVTIPKSITHIGECALSYCYELTEINIPENVAVIEQAAFIGNSNCEKFIVDEENEWYSSSDGILFNKDKTTLVAYPMAKSGSTYIMPDSVVTIAPYVFWCNSNITSYTLSKNLENIGFYSFFSTVATEITLYDKVSKIDIYAFSANYSLTDTYYYGTEEQWNEIEIGEGNYMFTEHPLHFMVSSEEPADNVFVFKLNDKNVYCAKENTHFTIDVPCTYVGSRTYLSFRAAASASGITDIKYDEATSSITFTGFDGYSVKMTIGSTVCELTAADGSKLNISISAPVMIDGVTCLSARDTANLTGGSVKYNDNGYILVSPNAIDGANISEYISAFESAIA